jgi:hypothetical protein
MSSLDFNKGGTNDQMRLVRISGDLGGVDYTQVTTKEINATESLLTPGLQTSVTLQSQIYNNTIFKNWDRTKGQKLRLDLKDALGNEMTIDQRIYRLDNREFMPLNTGRTEEMTFHACDASLLEDAKHLVSKSWKCTTPDDIVRYCLSSCLSVDHMDIQKSSPARDYIADSIHPFQVISQMANMALDENDPSFVHYMTYGVGSQSQPTHHFKSLKKLTAQPSKFTYYNTETGLRGNSDYNSQSSGNKAIHFMFPCDFDLLSDLLNGVDESGADINIGTFLNVSDATGSAQGGNINGCIQNGNLKVSLTNKGTSKQQNGCDTEVEKYLLRRQARMGLLEKDKVTFRLIAPWNPNLHAGDVITFKWKDKDDTGTLIYGSGDYLIVSMTHKIRLGGYATTTFDCVAKTVGQGKIDHE